MKPLVQNKLCKSVLALALGISVLVPTVLVPTVPADARGIRRVNVPRFGNAGRRVPGGVRGRDCITKDNPMVAIRPISPGTLTASNTPQVFFYLPKPKSATGKPLTLEVVVSDRTDRLKYSQSKYELQGQQGIVGVPLPTSQLELNKEYEWSVTLVCDENDRSNDQLVRGVIKRMQPSAQLQQQLAKATPEERVALYAENGFWQDTLMTLTELRLQRPSDTSLKSDWETLIKSDQVALDKDKDASKVNLLQAPIVPTLQALKPVAK